MLALLSKLIPGKSDPKSAMQYLVKEVEKKINEPVNYLVMEVDFSSEQITMKLPEKKLQEKIDSAFLFSIISNALTSYLTDEIKDVEVNGLIVEYKSTEPLKCAYYYTRDGEKLKSTKIFNNGK
jgi:hypothetical protein